MMRLKKIFFALICVFFITQGFSQRKFPPNSYNRLGVQGALTYGNIYSEDFTFIDRYGFSAGFATRATAGKKIFFIYGVNFYQFNTSMETLSFRTFEPEEIDFKATGVQINFFVGHKLIGENLSLEGGPVLQINSKLSPEEGKEGYLLKEYDLVALDLEDISRMNFSVAAGLSGGLPGVKLWVQYQYGLSNLFSKLNYEELREKDPTITSFKGNMRMALVGAVIYF